MCNRNVCSLFQRWVFLLTCPDLLLLSLFICYLPPSLQPPPSQVLCDGKERDPLPPYKVRCGGTGGLPMALVARAGYLWGSETAWGRHSTTAPHGCTAPWSLPAHACVALGLLFNIISVVLLMRTWFKWVPLSDHTTHHMNHVTSP